MSLFLLMSKILVKKSVTFEKIDIFAMFFLKPFEILECPFVTEHFQKSQAVDSSRTILLKENSTYVF